MPNSLYGDQPRVLQRDVVYLQGVFVRGTAVALKLGSDQGSLIQSLKQRIA
ncbi:MAG: hypothetical protein KDE56_32695 [Anaerolineales bacterium]|nr:hypothetical protein [Anaerolineales bacterium]